MAKSGDSDSANYAKRYEDQPLSERERDGLRVDRRADNRLGYFLRKHFKPMEAGYLSRLLHDPQLVYTLSRNWLWQTRRQANRKLTDNTQVHSQMIRLWRIVMPDLLGADQPSVKGLKKQSRRDDKWTRRTRKDYPHMVNDASTMEVVVVGRDGTRTIPMNIARERPRDERIQTLSTTYSSRHAFPRSFDLKVFSDAAYIRRQRKFWKDALAVLSKWLDDGNGVRPDSEWLIYHMVNNDIAMHVLFDNLSAECESRWFERLGDSTRYEVAGRIKMKLETLLLGKGEWDPCFDKIRDQILAAMTHGPEIPKAVRVDGKEMPIGGTPTARSVLLNLLLRVINPNLSHIHGHVPDPRHVIEREQHPHTEEDAMESLDELAEFVAGFKEEVPDSLRRYAIGQDKMALRIDDLLHTMIAYWKNYSLDWAEMVTKALARHRHNSKRAARDKAGE